MSRGTALERACGCAPFGGSSAQIGLARQPRHARPLDGQKGSADRDARTPRRCTSSRSQPQLTSARSRARFHIRAPTSPPSPIPTPEPSTHAVAPGNALRIEPTRQITRADSPGSATGSRGCWHSPAGHTLGVQYNVTSATPGERKTKKNPPLKSSTSPSPAHAAALQTSITLRYGGCPEHRRLPRCFSGV